MGINKKGNPFDHGNEVQRAMDGLKKNVIQGAQKLLGNPNLSTENRGILKNVIGSASKLVNYARRATGLK